MDKRTSPWYVQLVACLLLSASIYGCTQATGAEITILNYSSDDQRKLDLVLGGLSGYKSAEKDGEYSYGIQSIDCLFDVNSLKGEIVFICVGSTTFNETQINKYREVVLRMKEAFPNRVVADRKSVYGQILIQ